MFKIYLLSNIWALLLTVFEAMFFFFLLVLYEYGNLIYFALGCVIFVFVFTVIVQTIKTSKRRVKTYKTYCELLDKSKLAKNALLDAYCTSWCNAVMLAIAFKEYDIGMSFFEITKHISVNKKRKRIKHLTENNL